MTSGVSSSTMKVIQHSTERLRTALVSNSQTVAKLYSKYTKEERRLLEEGFHPGEPGSLFEPITVHSDSDWILAHPEEPQDFETFYKDPYRRTPNADHSTIYLQTIGSFGEVGAQTDLYVEWLRDYCQAFFYGLSVKLLPTVTVSETRCSFRVNSNSHNLQILTGMGVFSFARYDDNFYTRSYAGRLKKQIQPKPGAYSVFDGYYTPPITSSLLLRSCKTMTHEIGHMFGMKHCQWMNCIMQGSNHLEESDRRPLDFCPICLHKLHVSVGFQIAERYKALLHWMEEDQSQTSQPGGSSACHASHSFPKPTEAFQTSKIWLHRCLDILEKR
ncbi:archaemetzincin-2 isoform X2 [Kryptolebias marmoratus]|uniref:archaemetzincin-2 isoform X2 n=1 Tax=Kryptolebias marmoratus TaxID=37003 RepID=UPI0007F8762D|nr:archaemetzincin-2 isoform X2 [Kryptolebias marmoratus]